METTNLEKNLTKIFESKYIVPLYQRNFAWTDEEISLLILDIYESFKRNATSNYFIGSLVVLRRRNGDFEIIDGQQRLTTITLMAKVLNFEWMKEPKLFYDSRPEVESFFASFYRTGSTNDVTFDYKVSHLIHAIDIIKETVINSDEKEPQTILSIEDLDMFKEYFAKQVFLVRVEIPEDTDVANYFEIMNNRGEQLHKHEILKAKMLDKIKHDKKQQIVFAKIWDACSQMDIPIQKLFIKEDRTVFFGDEYDSFKKTETFDNLKNCDDSNKDNTIDKILSKSNLILDSLPKPIEDIDDESDDKSIIDFPNFLMHIFKLKYSEIYKNNNQNENEIPLNEKDLLDVFDIISLDINVMEFIFDLLFYRLIFDRFIIKASADEDEEDSYKWSLEKPYKYVYEKTKAESLKFKNSYEIADQHERLIKCLSMLQVTFRNRKYKNWLQSVLSWFKEPKDIEIGATEFQIKLDQLVLDYYNNNFSQINLNEPYSLGTSTPHFLFNFIDYLYWVESKKKTSKKTFEFDFKYRNSVEHHLPQSFTDEGNKHLINNLGNLCLVSKSSNSRMNNEDPTGKAKIGSKYYKINLPPKQKEMYDLNNLTNNWGNEEIYEHYKNIVELLNRKEEILQFENY